MHNCIKTTQNTPGESNYLINLGSKPQETSVVTSNQDQTDEKRPRMSSVLEMAPGYNSISTQNSNALEFQPSKRLIQTSDNTSLFSALRNLLKCTVCFEIQTESSQCSSGHLICHDCITRLEQNAESSLKVTCPTCKIALHPGLSRCLLAQQLASELPTPCSYCGQCFRQQDLLGHENTGCEMRPVKCLYAPFGCPWTGQLMDLMIHHKGCFYPKKTVLEVEPIVRDYVNQHIKPFQELERAWNGLLSIIDRKPRGMRVYIRDINMCRKKNDENECQSSQRLYYTGSSTTLKDLGISTTLIDTTIDLLENKLYCSIKFDITNQNSLRYRLVGLEIAESKFTPIDYFHVCKVKCGLEHHQFHCTFKFPNNKNVKTLEYLTDSTKGGFQAILQLFVICEGERQLSKVSRIELHEWLPPVQSINYNIGQRNSGFENNILRSLPRSEFSHANRMNSQSVTNDEQFNSILQDLSTNGDLILNLNNNLQTQSNQQNEEHLGSNGVCEGLNRIPFLNYDVLEENEQLLSTNNNALEQEVSQLSNNLSDFENEELSLPNPNTGAVNLQTPSQKYSINLHLNNSNKATSEKRIYKKNRRSRTFVSSDVETQTVGPKFNKKWLQENKIIQSNFSHFQSDEVINESSGTNMSVNSISKKNSLTGYMDKLYSMAPMFSRQYMLIEKRKYSNKHQKRLNDFLKANFKQRHRLNKCNNRHACKHVSKNNSRCKINHRQRSHYLLHPFSKLPSIFKLMNYVREGGKQMLSRTCKFILDRNSEIFEMVVPKTIPTIRRKFRNAVEFAGASACMHVQSDLLPLSRRSFRSDPAGQILT